MSSQGALLGAAALAVVGLFAPRAGNAGSIAVNNASFGDIPPGGFSQTVGCIGLGCSYSRGVGEIPDWTNPSDSGEQILGTQVGNFFAFDTIPVGVITAYSNTDSISQTVGATVHVRVVYTLQVDLGWRNDDQTFASGADLLINGKQYFATGAVPVQGNWSNFTATYTGLAADAGDPITIELDRTGPPQADFDNVRLSESPAAVPEPASLVLLGSGILGLGLVRRRLG